MDLNELIYTIEKNFINFIIGRNFEIVKLNYNEMLKKDYEETL